MSKILKKTMLFSLGTVFSRLLGFFREIIFSYYFGASFFSDLFFSTFRIPNFLRKLLAEGTLSFAYINVYTDVRKNKGKENADRLSSAFFWNILIICVFLYICVLFFSKEIVDLLLKGFPENKLILAAYILKWVFPFIIFISISSIFSGYLNIKGDFFLPAVSSAILNLFLIICVFFFYVNQYEVMGKYLGISIIFSGFFQFLLLFYGALKNGFNLSFTLWNKDLKTMLFYFIPGTFAMAITQINVLVDSFFASYLPDGGYSYLWYGNRLVQFPLAIFGIAISTVMTPYFAQNKGSKKSINGLFKALRLNTVLLIPCTLGLIFLSEPIIRLIFYRGKFDMLSLINVSKVLYYYSFGLWFYSGLKIMLPMFYSMGRMKIPVVSAFLSLVVNTVLNYILIKKMGSSGLALATSISAMVNMIFLWFCLNRNIKDFFNRFAFKYIFITTIFSFLLYLLKDFNLFFNIGVSILIYFFLIKLFNIEESNELLEQVKKRFKGN